MAEDRQIAVIGAGLMGHGIALIFARAGHLVSIYDPAEEMMQSVSRRMTIGLHQLGATAREITRALERIKQCGSIGEAVADAAYVFEAAPEKLELKRTIFAEVEKHAPEDAVLASNTSVIQISKIMGALRNRDRALGTHWWNPPHMIPLVEVVKTAWTDPARADDMYALLEDTGKSPVMVEKDVPGFIGNRLQHALWREAISLVENDICTAEAVDDVVKSSFGRRMAVLGPLENADLIGIELAQDIQSQVLYDLENTAVPSPYLQKLRDQGRTGMAAGAGFRNWQDGDLEKTRDRVAEHLLKLGEVLPN